MKILALVGVAVLFFACTTQQEQATRVEPSQVPEAASPVEAAPFVVSQEVYSRTFEEIEQFIRSLNQLIREADFAGWQQNLSAEYIRTVSDPLFLREQSEKPLLRQSGIELRDLRDYFVHVVVPSRSQAQLDEIEFLDENRVKALSVVHGTRVILYLLSKDNGGWKISVW